MTSATPSGEVGGVGRPGDDRLIVRLATGAWGIGVAVGIISVLLGLAIVTWPDATLRVVAVLFGLMLVIHGVYRIAQAIAVDEASGSTRVLFTLLGVLSFVIGVIVLRHPLQTVELLALLFGLFWLVGGIVELVAVLTTGSLPGRGLAAGMAGLSVLAGLVLLVWPDVTLAALTWLLGLWLFTWGLLTVAFTLWIRHADKRLAGVGR
ncbi:HdeD family acid-resistance protein [Spirillospora sp. CA-255316]